ncbi:hypothetical protein CBM2615_U10111 [Cupriavidus taiwanensis]|uniref:Uncharacterized protein n=1 Tax=Cupriavidus taiwanensis TaxID=164546 RepID=A0A375HCT7_9BURK|nr:hypothetical protein CBM2614_U10117 [Cupriavidus taiwanensis]SOZ73434.1 hypothetical protein CBM2615_U10111 [Cupriavidus taiwanensis]SOZ75103.1 hypothetical protein CBM2613_U10005 [Cupriavidus taiwanensis]SPA57596.1 protein of unknown function [Cupriavidus taiwanensis]SPD48708.1 protein of unknown function [Cupriavidus taiwanensis]
MPATVPSRDTTLSKIALIPGGRGALGKVRMAGQREIPADSGPARLKFNSGPKDMTSSRGPLHGNTRVAIGSPCQTPTYQAMSVGPSPLKAWMWAIPAGANIGFGASHGPAWDRHLKVMQGRYLGQPRRRIGTEVPSLPKNRR